MLEQSKPLWKWNVYIQQYLWNKSTQTWSMRMCMCLFLSIKKCINTNLLDTDFYRIKLIYKYNGRRLLWNVSTMVKYYINLEYDENIEAKVALELILVIIFFLYQIRSTSSKEHQKNRFFSSFELKWFVLCGFCFFVWKIQSSFYFVIRFFSVFLLSTKFPLNM